MVQLEILKVKLYIFLIAIILSTVIGILIINKMALLQTALLLEI